jgi:hypothetical protein
MAGFSTSSSAAGKIRIVPLVDLFPCRGSSRHGFKKRLTSGMVRIFQTLRNEFGKGNIPSFLLVNPSTIKNAILP